MEDRLILSRGFLESALKKLELAEYCLSKGFIRDAAENLTVASEMLLKALYFGIMYSFILKLHNEAKRALPMIRGGLWRPSIEINIQRVDSFIKKFSKYVKVSPKNLGHEVYPHWGEFLKEVIESILHGGLGESIKLYMARFFSQIKNECDKLDGEELDEKSKDFLDVFIETTEKTLFDLIAKFFSTSHSASLELSLKQLEELLKQHEALSQTKKKKCYIKHFEYANKIIRSMNELLEQVFAKYLKSLVEHSEGKEVCLDDFKSILKRYETLFQEDELNLRNIHELITYIKRTVKYSVPVHLLLAHSHFHSCNKASYPDVVVEESDDWENVLKGFASSLKAEIEDARQIIEES